MTNKHGNLPTLTAGAGLVALCLLTGILRDQALADGFRLAACKSEQARLVSRARTRTVQLSEQLSRVRPDAEPTAPATLLRSGAL